MTTVLTLGDITTDGQPDGSGVRWTCQAFTGWGSPGVTLSVLQRQQDHGGWGGGSWLKPRVLTAAGRLVAPDQATALAAVDRLCVAASLDSTILVVSEDGFTRQCTVRRDDEVLTTWETDAIVSWSIQLVAPDPRRYSTDLISASTGLPSSAGGLTWPLVSAVLNSNTSFEGGISPWTAIGGTVAASAVAFAGSGSLLLTPDGVTSAPEARSENVAATAGASYTVTAWLIRSVTGSVGLGIVWRNSGGTIITTSTQTMSVSAGVWTPMEVQATAPAGTTQAQITAFIAGTPPASQLLHVDEAMLGPTGGLTWPVTWPATVTSGVLGVDLAGNIATRPRFVITGPCSDPAITLVGSGHVLSWDLDLAAGQFLDVDVDRRTSLINGQVSRSGAMTSRDWFDLPPGHSDLSFNAAAFNSTARLTVTCRSAWL